MKWSSVKDQQSMGDIHSRVAHTALKLTIKANKQATRVDSAINSEGSIIVGNIPFVASCLRGALPPVDLRAVCLVRAIGNLIKMKRRRLRQKVGRFLPRGSS